MGTVVLSSEASHYGLVGQFRIKSALQDAARSSGLRVRQEGTFSRSYRVEPVFNNVALGNIIPSHIKSQELENGAHRMSRGEVKKFLTFLHQPLRTSLDHAAEQDIQAHAKDAIDELTDRFGSMEAVLPVFLEQPAAEIRAYEKERRDQALEKLILLQRFLRFATTGSVRQGKEKKFHHQGDKVTDDDEHIGVQRQIEKGTKLQNAEEMDSKFIPRAFFDGRSGQFVIKLHPRIHNGFEGEAQNELAAKLRRIITAVAPEQGNTDALKLSSAQLESFCRAFHEENGTMAPLMEKTAHEEHIQHALLHIAKRAQKIEKDRLLQKLSAAQGPTDTEKKLSNLLKSTSALTGLLQSEMLENAWKRYHYTDRDDAPIDDILNEVEALQAVSRHYITRGTISAAEMEAITHEFMPLLMFGADAMHSSGHSLKKTMDEAGNVLLCADLEEQFRSASLTQHGLDRRFMPEGKRDLLEALDMYSGGKKFSTSKKVGELLSNYARDVGNSIREHPKITIGVIAALVAALRISKLGQTNTAAFDPGQMMDFFDVIVADGTVHATLEGAKDFKQSHIRVCHLDLVFTDVKNMITTGSPLKEHCLGQAAGNIAMLGEMWRLPLRTAMEFTGQPVVNALASAPNQPFGYGDHFIATLPKVDEFWQWTNYPQDLSHSGYWGWSALKGTFQGFAGTAALLKLFNPMMDLAYTCKSNIADKIHGRSKEKIAAESMRAILRGIERHEPIKNKEKKESDEAPAMLVSNLWLGKRMASCSADSLDRAELAIDRMHMRADYLADENGLAESYRRETMKKEIDRLGQIIADYRAGGNITKFEKDVERQLARAAALEYAHTGGSEIYHSFINAEGIDEKTGRKLRSLGLHIMRNAGFNETRKNNLPFISREVPLGHFLKASAVTAGTFAGNALSHTLKFTRLAKESKISDLFLKPVINSESAGIAANLSRPGIAVPGAISALSIYLDKTGHIHELSPTAEKIVQAISDHSGDLTAVAFSTANFFGWNVTVSDLLQVHFVTGLALSTLAATTIHYPNRFVIRPLKDYFREIINRPPEAPPAPAPIRALQTSFSPPEPPS